MIDTVLNLLFRCSHRHLTRPVTPVNKAGVPEGGTYVVCLDCAKQFPYDMKEMRMGKPIEPSHGASVVPHQVPSPAKKKLKDALWAVPVEVLLGVALKSAKSRSPEKPGDADKAPR